MTESGEFEEGNPYPAGPQRSASAIGRVHGPSSAQGTLEVHSFSAALPSPHPPCLLMRSLINCQAGFNSSLLLL